MIDVWNRLEERLVAGDVGDVNEAFALLFTDVPFLFPD
jgi:hypothetical protein